MQRKLKGKTRIVLTGGHAATTAVAVIEELRRQESENKAWDIYWIGAKTLFEGKNISTPEENILPRLKVTFRPIVAGRIQRKFTFWTIPSIAKIPLGFFYAFRELARIKPEIILSFGGFVAFPVVVMGYILGIPVILHEQTVEVGRANRFSSFFAKKIAVARAESIQYFSSEKCVLTGNPVMEKIFRIPAKTKPSHPFTIFVTGGSRGSMIINSLIGGNLIFLLKDNRIIHQTGQIDYQKYANLKETLPASLRENYEVVASIDPTKIDSVYRRADLLVGRAGANTVSEIMIIKIPSILIPIPFAYKNEQEKNADVASSFGIAKVLGQEALSAKILYREILYVKKNWEYYVSKARKKISPDIGAAKKVVELINETINK